MRKILLSAACFLLAGASEALASAKIVSAEGLVEVQGFRTGGWEPLARTPYPLRDGDRVRTGTRARAGIEFHDGSTIRLGADTSGQIEEASPKRISLVLDIGEALASAAKVLSRRFEVRTPAAVCTVRGTEFRVKVLSGGRTDVDLYSGLLGVEDLRGRQILLHPNESLRVDPRGMGVPQRSLTRSERRSAGTQALARKEGALDRKKASALAEGARAARLDEYEQGKALVDSSGRRVRVEEFLLRPRADQFKLVALNERRDRFDYFYFLGTFNQALPGDLASALRGINGGVDAAPGWFMTAYETGRSNTVDSLREAFSGGHLVDVNANADPTDDVETFFDDGLDRFVDVAGRSVFVPIYDGIGVYVNGRLKYGWTGANLQSQNDAVLASNVDPITGSGLTSANAYIDGGGNLFTRTATRTFPDTGLVRLRIREDFTDGTFINRDSAALDIDGSPASSEGFGGSLSGTSFAGNLLRFNLHETLSASEFGGRTIDLVLEPKILVQTGFVTRPGPGLVR